MQERQRSWWLIWRTGLNLLQNSGESPCSVSSKRRQQQHICCNGCKHWVHKKCSGLLRLTPNPDYTKMHMVNGNCPTYWQQTDFLLQPGWHAFHCCRLWTGCHYICTCVKTAWKKFKQLLPVLTSHHLSYNTRLLAIYTALQCRVWCYNSMGESSNFPKSWTLKIQNKYKNKQFQA